MVLRVGPALLAFAFWRSVWWQWVLPPEDFAFDVWLWLPCVAAILVGLSITRVGWNWRMALIAAAILSTIWPVVVILILSPLLLLMLLAPGYLAYRLVRRVARGNSVWRIPLAIALVPVFVATLAAMPPLDSYEWLRPWVSFRAPILRFQDQTDAAADRLGLPVGRKLTKDEIDAWSAITPLRLRLRYPIVGTEVTVSAINPWTDERFHGLHRFEYCG